MADLFKALSQGGNRRHLIEGAHPAEKTQHFFLHDRFRLFGLLGAPLKIILGDAFEIVDVVEIDVVEIVDLGVKVSPVTDVNKKHRLLFALAQNLLDQIGADQHVRGAGATDDEIGDLEIAGEILEANRAALNFLRQLDRAIEGPIGHHHAAHAVASQAARHQIAHLAGSDQHDRLVVEPIENSFRQIDRDRAHRHGAAADAGLAAHPFRDREGPMKQPVQNRADRARLLRGIVVLL